MTSVGYLALAVAVGSNFVANIALKRAMGRVSGDNLWEVLGTLLSTAAFWVGMGFAVLLLGSYLFAIRILPLSTSYAAVTALTIALLTVWGFWSGTDTLTLPKVVGVIAIIAGFVLVTVPFGAGR